MQELCQVNANENHSLSGVTSQVIGSYMRMILIQLRQSELTFANFARKIGYSGTQVEIGARMRMRIIRVQYSRLFKNSEHK